MWCTRWFLLLFLLPYPRASPYFLILYLFSLILHSRPCLYCVVLLTALFTSSCYWAPTDLPMPTFLSSTKPSEPVKIEERCWCDLNNGNLFDPFPPTPVHPKAADKEALFVVINQAQDRSLGGVLADRHPNDPSATPEDPHEPITTTAAHEPAKTAVLADLARIPLRWLEERYFRPTLVSSSPAPLNDVAGTSHTSHATSRHEVAEKDARRAEAMDDRVRPRWMPSWLKRRYDLREHGVGLIVDLGWGRMT